MFRQAESISEAAMKQSGDTMPRIVRIFKGIADPRKRWAF